MSAEDDLATTSVVEVREGAAVQYQLRRCLLEVIAGPDAGARVEVGESTLTVGTSKGCSLRLTDTSVSRIHLEVRVEAGGYRVRDLQSTNGTFIGELRLVEVVLARGAELALGRSRVRFVPLPSLEDQPLATSDRCEGLVGRSAVMRRLFWLIERAAATDFTVLITGETGSGKELAAEALHLRSGRAEGPFVVFDCGAASPTLIESALFGHERGAFSGADRAHAGVFEQASGGTLFLDEIGELPLDVQPKLLRALERKEVRRIGGPAPLPVDVRIAAATHRDLAVEVNRGRFREDLYYRLTVVQLRVPPLRERLEDLPMLVEQLLAELGEGLAPPSASSIELLRQQDWPGNVRQLRNVLERAATLGEDPANVRTGPAEKRAKGKPLHVNVDPSVPFKQAKQQVTDEFERLYLDQVLERHHGNITAAARATGLDRMSIYRIVQRLGIRPRRG